MTFADFLRSYRADTLDDFAGWRAYDIQGNVRPAHTQAALKLLGFTYAGELAVPEVMARYGLTDRPEAEAILGAWWALRQIEGGMRFRWPLRAVAEEQGWLRA